MDQAGRVTEAELFRAQDEYQGWCRCCGDFTRDCCEPDARKYKCPVCGEHEVYGAEEAVLCGYLALTA
jgi:hypothetical protein